jgi:DNA polymerase III delta prime subunit
MTLIWREIVEFLLSNQVVAGVIGVTVVSYLSTLIRDRTTQLIGRLFDLLWCSVRIKTNDALYNSIAAYIGRRVLVDSSDLLFASGTKTDTSSLILLGFYAPPTGEDADSRQSKRGTRFSPHYRDRSYRVSLLDHTVWVSATPETHLAGQQPVPGMLTLSMVGFWNSAQLCDLFEKICIAAKEEMSSQVVVYSHANGHWTQSAQVLPRSPRSVVIAPGQMTTIIDDAKRFIASREWYLQRGLPYRRGYLLHGKPGMGKSSTVMALASALKCNIYVLNLQGMRGSLEALCQAVPVSAILLIEDIDVAFASRVAATSTEAADGTKAILGSLFGNAAVGSPTMSQLLNALDGVGAGEGRLFVATTNYPDRIDPALMRTGRIDVKVSYEAATREQTMRYFVNFYKPSDAPAVQQQIGDDKDDEDSEHDDTSEKESIYCGAYDRLLENWTCTTKEYRMAERFWQAIDSLISKDGVHFAMSDLQEYLMKHRHSAFDAIRDVQSLLAQCNRDKTSVINNGNSVIFDPQQSYKKD